jgi:hypothetical protein
VEGRIPTKSQKVLPSSGECGKFSVGASSVWGKAS